ncbi:MAG TPA: TOMM precursor leader peptide-binding protein [Kineosporiaceae bacterium]|nr:TOMM precursor leader peptide-binding protein [Kineosporiaceae bacterium]
MSIVPDDESPLIGFKRHLRAAVVPGDAVYLTSGRGTITLSGPHIQTLAPLLTGERTLAEVHQLLGQEIPPAALSQMLAKLAQANLIGLRRPAPRDGGRPAADPAAEAYWDLAHLEPDPDAGLAAVVELVTLGKVDAASATVALRAAGLPIAITVVELDSRSAALPSSATPDLRLVLCDDYLDPALESLNARFLADGRSWLLAKPTGVDLWVGPFFRPGEGACWSCLATRLSGHRRGEQQVRSALGTGQAGPAPEASLACTRSLGLQLAALEVTKWLAGSRVEHQDEIWTLDTLSLQSGHHRVDRRPQCRSCGDTELMTTRLHQPVAITSRPKTVAGGNGHRAMAAQQVWDRYQQLSNPVTGVTGAVQRDARCPEFIHSYLSGPNLALAGANLSAMRASLRQQSGGKGRTDLEARVGALCEGVERYCGTRFGDEPVVRDSLSGLGADAVDPDTCQLYDHRQFQSREDWNASTMPFQHVPEPFDSREPIDWTPTWSLTADRHRLLPTDLLYFTSGGHPAMRANSNGNAAGSSPEDAIVQGFLELVERDAVALWWYNRTRAAAVDLTSLDDPWIDELRAQYRSVHREFWVLDVTADLGIPTMVAISRRTDKPAEDLMLGFGAHFDPRIAARRALTELGQLLPAVVGARPDGSGYGQADASIQHWWRTATTANQPYLRPDDSRKALRPQDYDYSPRTDLKDDIEAIVDLARCRNLEVLVLDQTRPDIGMPVFKVIVPGLRHFWARFAPGRLFDVPVRLGRLAAPTEYQDLNPTPLFL